MRTVKVIAETLAWTATLSAGLMLGVLSSCGNSSGPDECERQLTLCEQSNRVLSFELCRFGRAEFCESEN